MPPIRTYCVCVGGGVDHLTTDVDRYVAPRAGEAPSVAVRVMLLCRRVPVLLCQAEVDERNLV